MIEKEEDVVWDNIKDDVINKMPENYDSFNEEHRSLFIEEIRKHTSIYLEQNNSNAPAHVIIVDLFIENFDWDKSKHLV